MTLVRRAPYADAERDGVYSPRCAALWFLGFLFAMFSADLRSSVSDSMMQDSPVTGAEQDTVLLNTAHAHCTVKKASVVFLSTILLYRCISAHSSIYLSIYLSVNKCIYLFKFTYSPIFLLVHHIVF